MNTDYGETAVDPQTVASVHIDNDRVIVTAWSLDPGASTGLHLHERDYVVVPQTSGTMELAEPGGKTRVAALTAGSPYWRTAGIEHDVRNTGDETIVFIEIELR